MAMKAGPFPVAKRRGSAELKLSVTKKAGLTKIHSLQLLSKPAIGRKSMPASEPKAKTVNLYGVPTDPEEPPSISVQYRSCVYTLRPRPDEYYALIDRLQSVVLFQGDPVMTYTDPQGKLRYVTDPHEMTRAYRDFPTLLMVDLRFD